MLHSLAHHPGTARSWLPLVMLLSAACTGAWPAVAAGIPVIYCTDLFHPHEDPDDHFDLASIYALRELDLKAIVLDQGARQKRQPGSIPVSQMNRLTGRQVPAVPGLAQALASPTDKALDQATEYQGGVATILKTLRGTPAPVRIAVVGSVRDVVAAFNREPGLLRTKVDRLLVFIGEASDPEFREYNVGLDPHAYVGLMRSGLPVWWVPCFDGGPWQNRGHASFWKATHRDVLRDASPSLVQYFIYALEHEKAEPLAFLALSVDPARQQKLFAGERNLWCTAIFAALAWPASQTGDELFGFVPVDLSIGDDASVRYGPGPDARKVMRFEIRDPARYPAEMTRRTARLLRSTSHAPAASRTR